MITKFLAKLAGKLADTAEKITAEARAEMKDADLDRIEELERQLAKVLSYTEELEELEAMHNSELENERQRCETQSAELAELEHRAANATQAAIGWKEHARRSRAELAEITSDGRQTAKAYRALTDAFMANKWFAAMPPQVSEQSPCELFASYEAARSTRPDCDIFPARIKG